MNAKKEGALLLLGTILISCTLTYLLTKAKYEKKPVVPAQQINPDEKPDNKTKNEIALQANETEKPMDVTQYAEKYKNKHDALVRDYRPDQPVETDSREIIDEDTFESNPAYDAVSYTLFQNNVLMDEQERIVTDPDETIGRDVIERFNELEHNDAVYVRNHDLKMDFEILRVPRSYIDPAGGSHAVRA